MFLSCLCCWTNTEMFIDCSILLYFTSMFSQFGIPLTLSLLAPLLVCAGCTQSCVSDICRKVWLLCAAVCLNSLTKKHLVCKAELEPRSAAETLQLEFPLPLSAHFLHQALSMLKQTLQFSSIFNYCSYACVSVCVDERVKDRECVESFLSRNFLSRND